MSDRIPPSTLDPTMHVAREQAAQWLAEYQQAHTTHGHFAGWHTIPDDGRLYANLVRWLIQTDRPDTLRELFNSPAWLQARLQAEQGSYRGYLQDIARAWDYFVAQPMDEITLEDLFGLALLRSGFVTLAATYPASDIEAALRHGVWSLDRALSLIHQLPTLMQQLTAWLALFRAEKLTPSQRRDHLPTITALILGLPEPETRAAFRQQFAPYYQGAAMLTFVQAIREIESPTERAQTLVRLTESSRNTQGKGAGIFSAEHLLTPYLDQFLARLSALDEAWQGELLREIAPWLPIALREPIRRHIDRLQDPFARSQAMSGLLGWVHGAAQAEMLTQVLMAVSHCTPAEQTLSYCRLLPYIDGDALALADLVERATALDNPALKAHCFVALYAAHPTERPFAEIALHTAPHLDQPISQWQIVNRLRAFPDLHDALQTALPALDPTIQALIAWQWQAEENMAALEEGMALLADLPHPVAEAAALLIGITYLPRLLAAQLFSLMTDLADESAQASVGAAVGVMMTDKAPWITHALAFKNAAHMATVLVAMAAHLSDLEQERLIVALHDLPPDGQTALWMAALLPYQADAARLAQTALTWLKGDTEDEARRAKAFLAVVPYLGPDSLPTAIEVARGFTGGMWRGRALRAVALRAEGEQQKTLFQEALTSTLRPNQTPRPNPFGRGTATRPRFGESRPADSPREGGRPAAESTSRFGPPSGSSSRFGGASPFAPRPSAPSAADTQPDESAKTEDKSTRPAGLFGGRPPARPLPTEAPSPTPKTEDKPATPLEKSDKSGEKDAKTSKLASLETTLRGQFWRRADKRDEKPAPSGEDTPNEGGGLPRRIFQWLRSLREKSPAEPTPTPSARPPIFGQAKAKADTDEKPPDDDFKPLNPFRRMEDDRASQRDDKKDTPAASRPSPFARAPFGDATKPEPRPSPFGRREGSPFGSRPSPDSDKKDDDAVRPSPFGSSSRLGGSSSASRPSPFGSRRAEEPANDDDDDDAPRRSPFGGSSRLASSPRESRPSPFGSRSPSSSRFGSTPAPSAYALILKEGVEIIAALDDVEQRALHLGTILPHVTDALRPEVGEKWLAALAALRDEHTTATIVQAAAATLNPSQAEQALATIMALPISVGQLQAMTALVPQLSATIQSTALTHLTTHLNSLPLNARLEALAAIVKHRKGDNTALIKQGLKLAEDVDDSVLRLKALDVFIARLGPRTLPETLLNTQLLTDETLRVEFFEAAAPHLKDDKALGAARQVVRTFDDRVLRTRALRTLYRLHPHQDILEEALVVAHSIEEEIGLFYALESLIGFMKNEPQMVLIYDALDAARAIEDDWERTKALIALTPHLGHRPAREDIVQEALISIRMIPDGWIQAGYLRELAAKVQGEQKMVLQREALEALQRLDDMWVFADELSLLIPDLSNKLLPEVLNAIQELTDDSLRARVLIPLAPQFVGAFARQGLNLAKAIQSDMARAEVLAALVPHLIGDLLREAFHTIRQLPPHPKAVAFATVITTINAAKFQEAWEGRANPFRDRPSTADTDSGPSLGEFVAKAFAERLGLEPEPRDDDAPATAASLTAGQGLSEDYLETLRQTPPALIDEALQSVLRLGTENEKAQALEVLIPRLDGAGLIAVLQMAQNFSNEAFRAQLFVAAAPHLESKLSQAALTKALAMDTPYHQAETVHLIAPYLSPAHAKTAFEATVRLSESSEPARSAALKALLPRLGPTDLLALVDALDTLEPRAVRLGMWRAWVDYLPDKKSQYQLWERILSPDLTRLDLEAQLVWSIWLFPRLTPTQQVQILSSLLSLLAQLSPTAREYLLLALLPHLSAPVITETALLEWMEDYIADNTRLQMMALLLPTFSIPQREAHLATIWQHIKKLPHAAQSSVIQKIAPYLQGEGFMKALQICQNLSDRHEYAARSYAYAGLAPYLTGDLLDHALQEVLRMKNDEDRPITRKAFAHCLDGDQLRAELDAIGKIRSAYLRRQLIEAFAPYLNAESWESARITALDIDESGERIVALSVLAAHAPNGLKADAVTTVLAMMGDSQAMLNLKTALVNLVPHLEAQHRATFEETLPLLPVNLQAEVIGAWLPYLEATEAEAHLTTMLERLPALPLAEQPTAYQHLAAWLRPAHVNALRQSVSQINDARYRLQILSVIYPHATTAQAALHPVLMADMVACWETAAALPRESLLLFVAPTDPPRPELWQKHTLGEQTTHGASQPLYPLNRDFLAPETAFRLIQTTLERCQGWEWR